jgi:hypothetical protein
VPLLTIVAYLEFQRTQLWGSLQNMILIQSHSKNETQEKFML